ncbi:uncharacterized protein LOC126377043 isoform X2 [Pectinophora gossypiella]|uniref:uncharacterized protein LOC126377043 isoform X2 n=1 Tax=Pectinophora gossypiella TaxID=13191 RepID=UPI00214EFA7B|nr:uncharacterized protein LOC126377043 isoform X2 [Pectinophora gossypiella]
MTPAALLIAAALLGQARAVVHLSCSDNATCIENLTNEFVRSVRQQKTVRLFDALTVEPLGTWQKRSSEGLLEKILNNNAFSFDWNDYTFRIWKAQDKNDALDLEVYESRTAKDVSEELPKKSKSKVEEEDEESDKKTPVVVKGDPKRRGGLMKRRAKKKIMQAVIPMLFGMKSAAAVIFAMAVVTVLTLKAFIASKMALMVTVGMAVKRLYESYSLGVGLQNHPYLYSQYPIDFPSASSHAYSVSGMSPQFPEMYNPTALGSHQQSELLHNDASAQQSQQAPVQQLLNSTRATERWDGYRRQYGTSRATSESYLAYRPYRH